MRSNQVIRLLLHGVAYLSLGYFSYLMLLITAQYIPLDFEVAFLKLKEEAIAHFHYRVAFFSHVYSSIFVLLAGFTQFSGWLRNRWPRLHRRVGITYILLILFVASPSGLVMGYYANGGIIPQLSFCILAVLWFVFTLQAYRAAKAGHWGQHRAFMWRSYALTLSAVSLRLFKWIIVSIWALPPMDTYRIVAVAGWVINWGLVELYLWRKHNG